jgi:hypothetical protein
MSANDPTSSYAVDLVFCIDCTGSMKPYIESVKGTALDFHRLLEKKMSEKDKAIRQLRVRLVAFRDLGEEGPGAIDATSFFELPNEADAFNRAVSGLAADGGGDEPESALEALVVAIRSPWERGLDKRRHVIVMCTDAPAHPLGKFAFAAGEQSALVPRSLEELQSLWGDEVDEGEMEYAAKRLLVFGPNAYPWNELSERFENCIWVASIAGQGMREADQEVVLDQVAGSV